MDRNGVWKFPEGSLKGKGGKVLNSLKKLSGHIGLGLSLRACMSHDVSVRISVTLCIWSRTVQDKILKFNIWNKHEK